MSSIEPKNSQAIAEPVVQNAKACAIVLSGGLRPSPLMQETGCATLDLHITPAQSIADIWRDRLDEILGDDDPTRVIPSRSCPTPRAESLLLGAESDDFRGPGGVVRDAAQNLGNGPIVVVEAARYLDASLVPLHRHHQETGAMATVGVNHDGSPAGVYCISREALELVPARGFMDLKEQWLPLIGQKGRVEVVELSGRGALPLQTRQDFLNAAAWIARGHRHEEMIDSIWWSPESGNWTVRAEGALIEEGAFVENSVLQPGAIVRAGAVVARSLVCANAIVESGGRVVDRTIATVSPLVSAEACS